MQSSIFVRHMPHAYTKSKGEPRKIHVENLEWSEFEVTYHLGVAEKPYSDVSSTWLSAFILVRKLTVHQLLLRYTILHRRNDIAKRLTHSLLAKVNKEAGLFSLAVDEQTDVKDSAQLLVVIRSPIQVLICVRIFFPWEHSRLVPVEKTSLLQLKISVFAMD